MSVPASAEGALDRGAAPRSPVTTARQRTRGRVWSTSLGPLGSPLFLPVALLLIGALIGLPFTLDSRVAGERLIGLVVDGLLAAGALLALRRLPDRRVPIMLLATAGVALLGGAWIIAATGHDVFRGPAGAPLERLFGPLFGMASLTDPVEITNTRFIVGYNGLADLCLLAMFAAGGVLFSAASVRSRVIAAVLLAGSGALLLGTGSRGGLTGLLAGLWLIGLLAWRRGWVLALASTPLAVAVAALVLDKGLETTSTVGRFSYWNDLGRLLLEFPFTGVGLGVNTANAVAKAYEINPDPERIAYAHNTFVQAYLEQGPLGAIGMLLIPALAIAAAAFARREHLSGGRQAQLMAGLGLMGAMEAHGLTDQVVTTNVGTLLVLLALAAVLAAVPSPTCRRVRTWTVRAGGAAVLATGIALVVALVMPAERGRLLMNLGGLQVNQATLGGPQPDASLFRSAEANLQEALALDPGNPSVLRNLARARVARYDLAGAMSALDQAAHSRRNDAFDVLQIAHVYRTMGFGNEAYRWATYAYSLWNRPPPAAVGLAYNRATLPDDFRVRTLADQAEAALVARRYNEALPLFLEALKFAPESPYLLDRVGDAERGAYRMQLREGQQTP